MAQLTLNRPPTPRMGPNLADAAEFGESWDGLLAKLNLMLTDLYSGIESSANNLTAHAGGGQALATPMTARVNRFTTVATVGDSGLLPASTPGDRVVVINSTTNAMQIFGIGTDTINQVASGTGVSQAGRSVCVYTCGVAGQWESNDTGDGYAGNFSTVSVLNNITAHAGGGQASATPLTATINRVTTVVTSGDSTVLPPAIHGMQISVINAGAAPMNLFAASQTQGGVSGGDSMNGTQNGSLSVTNGKTALAVCAVDGQWHTILSA